MSNSALYEFPSLPDSIHQSNENAKVLWGICVEDGLMVFNNVKVHEQQHFKGGETYKKGSEWVSELDLCIISCNMLKYMNDVRVIYENDLPSDHAPLASRYYVS